MKSIATDKATCAEGNNTKGKGNVRFDKEDNSGKARQTIDT